MPAFRLFERFQSLAGRASSDLPPTYLRVLTAGSTEPEAFTGVGERVAREILALAEQYGRPLVTTDKVLDFGCGCGRVAAPLLKFAPVQLHGCDINRKLVAWCLAHLPGRFEITRPSPPLPYPSESFDLVYALSVFTHLTEDNAKAWLTELARVTRPSGLAILSFLDEHAPASAPFRAELLGEGFHIKRGGTEGSNLLTVFFSRDGFASAAAPGWRRLGGLTTPESASGQALMVFERI